MGQSTLRQVVLLHCKSFVSSFLRRGFRILSAGMDRLRGNPMNDTSRLDILHHFAAVADPRDGRFTTHRLGDILTIALCATLSGATRFEDLAAFGRAKETWLRSLGLALPHGIPSHDTFRDLFCQLAPTAFQDCFTSWINAACA